MFASSLAEISIGRKREKQKLSMSQAHGLVRHIGDFDWIS